VQTALVGWLCLRRRVADRQIRQAESLLLAFEALKARLPGGPVTPTTLPVRPRLRCVTREGDAFTVRARGDGSAPALARPPGGRGAFRFTGEHDDQRRAIYARVT